jgi:hypothetical protein
MQRPGQGKEGKNRYTLYAYAIVIAFCLGGGKQSYHKECDGPSKQSPYHEAILTLLSYSIHAATIAETTKRCLHLDSAKQAEVCT